MIFEALSAVKDPNGLDIGSIVAYIEVWLVSFTFFLTAVPVEVFWVLETFGNLGQCIYMASLYTEFLVVKGKLG